MARQKIIALSFQFPHIMKSLNLCWEEQIKIQEIHGKHKKHNDFP